MTEHVHEWIPEVYGQGFIGASCECEEVLTEAEVGLRLNATERLSAEDARTVSRGWRPEERLNVVLRAYADTLEEK